jgi:peroxiredoxin
MKRSFLFSILSFCISALISVSATQSSIAETKAATDAPNFSLVDSLGKTYSLSDLKGKFVVLEWLNHGCPFVRKHYSSGNMQKLQSTYTAKGVVWLSIASSAPGKEGFMTAEETNAAIKEKKSQATAVLIDSDGKVGKLYGARTTPHMFIINPESKLIYSGAIDDNSSSRSAAIEGAKNYVAQALDEAMAGKVVAESETEPYGCSVKYQS